MSSRTTAENLFRVLSEGRARLIPPGPSGAGEALHGLSPQQMEALRQSGRHVERILATPRPRSGPAVSVDVSLQQAAALDQLFITPGASQATTLRQVFAALRDQGVKPHSREPDLDAVVAAELLSVLDWSREDLQAAHLPGAPAAAAASRNTGSSAPDPADSSTRPQIPNSLSEPEAGNGPIPWFGVAEPAMPKTDSGELKYGTYAKIVDDLRDMGAGAVRRCKGRDVYWGSVFPIEGGFGRWDNGKQVPPPAELLAELRSDDYASLGYFSELLLACRMAGLEFDITPFDAGGGSGLNIHSPADADYNDDFNPLMEPGADGTTWIPIAKGWQTVLRSAPSWQEGVRVPSTHGWDEYYWNHGSPTDDDQQFFQRFAIQVWPTVDTATLTLTDGLATRFTDSYVRECARRKSLAIAAFSQGVAEMLARTHLAWLRRHGNNGIYAVVKTVELGNELNGQYVYHPSTDSATDLSASHQEAGRYMALVAAPFRWKHAQHALPRRRTIVVAAL